MSEEIEKFIDRIVSCMTRAQRPLGMNSIRALSGIEERTHVAKAIDRLIKRKRIVKMMGDDSSMVFALTSERKPSEDRPWLHRLHSICDPLSFSERLLDACSDSPTKSESFQIVLAEISKDILSLLKMSDIELHRQSLLMETAQRITKITNLPDIRSDKLLPIIDVALERLALEGLVQIEPNGDMVSLTEQEAQLV